MKAKKKNNKIDLTKNYKDYLFLNILFDIFAILLGLVLYMDAEMAVKSISIIVGLLLIVKGVLSIVSYYKNKSLKVYHFNIVFGSIAILLGLFLIVYPMTITNLLNIIVGIWLLVSGINKVDTALSLKKVKETSWLLTFVTGLILLSFSFMLIFNPFAKLLMAQLIGLFILVYAAVDLANLLLLHKRSTIYIKSFK